MTKSTTMRGLLLCYPHISSVLPQHINPTSGVSSTCLWLSSELEPEPNVGHTGEKGPPPWEECSNRP